MDAESDLGVNRYSKTSITLIEYVNLLPKHPFLFVLYFSPLSFKAVYPFSPIYQPKHPRVIFLITYELR